MEEENNKEESEKSPDPEKIPESESGSENRPEPENPPEAESKPETGSTPQSDESRQEVPPSSEEIPYSPVNQHKRLYKSRTNRILFGVCGGLGEYLNIDPVIIRLVFVLSFLVGGWGFLAYILVALIMPGTPSSLRASSYAEEGKDPKKDSENGKMILGSALILLGIYALLRTTGMLRYFNFFGITHEFIIPVILIGLGILLLVKHRDFLYKESPPSGKLYRSSSNRMIAGVCAGLGDYLNMDPTLIRIIWAILTFGSFGIGILIYILFALLVPLDNEVNLEK